MVLGKGAKRSFEEGGGSPRVLVQGFDFGTTDEQLMAHMGSVGTIQEVFWVSKGAANLIYSTPFEATAAINELNKTTIPGNTRFIDVIAGGDGAAKRFKGGDSWGGKGGGGWMYVPAWEKGKGKSKGKGGKNRDHSDEDPAGSGRVFVKGFDFGTSDEQLEGHMSQAGPIHTVHWVNKGNAVVVYKKKASAMKAIQTLDKSTIPGNSRFIFINERN